MKQKICWSCVRSEDKVADDGRVYCRLHKFRPYFNSLPCKDYVFSDPEIEPF